MIKQNIQADQIAAMKAKDMTRLNTLRYILAQIKNKEIDKHEELSDEEIIDVLRKESKKLNEAATEFTKGGRSDLAKENEEQHEIIAAYLPQELTDAALKEKIQHIISENQELFQKNSNALIGICVGKLKSEADSSRIAKMIRELQ